MSRKSRKGGSIPRNPKKRTSKPGTSNTSATQQPAANQDALHVYELRITLKSDLCAGSGDGFSSGIDQDVCYDAHGLPYIPARRIKGCLREAAQDIGVNKKVESALFGVRGSDRSGALSFGNATMDNADQSGGTSATLDRYTYTRAMTKVDRETGGAKDETLRFVRVVRHYCPDGVEASFNARVTLDESLLNTDNAEKEPKINEGFSEQLVTFNQADQQIKRCFLALRNIGMGRNRGFGAVRCAFEEVRSKDVHGSKNSKQNSKLVNYMRRDGKVALSYAVRLDAPVMLPQGNGERSHPCIPGTSVMGFFASRLRDRSDFNDLFFGNQVRFSPLYPVDGAGSYINRCLPAASFLAKIKGGARDGAICRTDTFEERPLETPKPLRDGFVSPSTWNKVDVATEIIYHHSTGTDATLYTQQCLSAGQLMAGFIECPAALAPTLEAILEQGTMSFGRSKSAQYARCSLVPCIRDLSGLWTKTDIVQGERYALLLESDALLTNEAACSSTSLDALETALRQEGGVGPWYENCDANNSYVNHCATSISAHTVGGYNAKWNQKKPHVRAIEAGSCLVFTAASTERDVDIVRLIGNRQSEGYGRVRLIRLKDVIPKAKESDSQGEPMPSTREQARMKALSYADQIRYAYFEKEGHLSNSFIGRLAMMVDESGLSNTLSFSDDLKRRIESIRDNDKRDMAQRLVEGLHEHLTSQGQTSINWQLEKECLLLLLALGKYWRKQAH